MKDKPTALPAKSIADKTSNSAVLLHGVKHSERSATITSERNYTQPVWGAVGGQHVGNYWEFYSMKLQAPGAPGRGQEPSAGQQAASPSVAL